MRQTMKEYSVYVIMAVLGFVITYWLADIGPLQPIGIALPAIEKNLPPANPQSLKIYNQLPAGAQSVGFVRVEMHFNQVNSSQEQQTLNYAKTLAASLGANGLVTIGVNVTPAGSEPSELMKYFLIGEAVNVSQ
ncbi:MAG: hypothetical protein KIT27_01015 [Legionellales bacterium]|nr:hypothetical protein [Legionellales bacterium]